MDRRKEELLLPYSSSVVVKLQNMKMYSFRSIFQRKRGVELKDD